MPSPSFTPASPSFTPASPSTSQRLEAVSRMPNYTIQTPDNLNAAAVETPLGSDLPDDPTERSTGLWAKVTNKKWKPAPRRSVFQADLKFYFPDILEYYEARRTGKIKAKSFEDWGEPVSLEEEHKLYPMEHGKVKRVFFEVNYNRGFTGRGVLPESMERPGLLGPRNEKIEEIAPPAGGLSYEQSDRPLWQAVDDKSGCPSERSKDVEKVGPFGGARDDGDVGPVGEARDDGDVGPLGETRDDEEEVGPFGETRDGDDGLRQGYDDGAQQKEEEEEEEEVTDDEDINHAMQLAAKAVSMLSGMLANTGTSTTTSTASSIEPGASLTSSSRTLSSTPPTTLRKRTRDSEGDPDEGAKDDESPSQQKRRRMNKALGIERTSSLQQKRRRMDNILGIERKDANAANNAQSTGAATTADLLVQQSRKRERTPDDDSEESMTRPGPKRARLQLNPPKPTRLNLRPMGDASDVEAHVADGAPKKDESTVVRQPISSNDVHNPVAVDKVTSVEVHTQASVEEVAFANEETNKCNDAAADDEVALSQKEWNTAHGINSIGANIRVDGMNVLDLTGGEVQLCLPTSKASSPYRLLTEKEKEDLRTYIQDYGVQDWHVLAKCMHSTVRGLKTEYLEYIVARNRQAGRRELAGIRAWPQLAPPPPPPPLPEADE